MGGPGKSFGACRRCDGAVTSSGVLCGKIAPGADTDYLLEHELEYLAATGFAGSVVATGFGFARRSRRPQTRVELWALFGGLVGVWLGIWLILVAPAFA